VPEQPAALGGLRVVDAATLAAGPLAATMLGEFGADVIKVEQPRVGDPMRTWGPMKDGVGLMWKSISRNKQCVTADLRVAAGQALLHQLLAVSDVLIVNARVSALTRWGLDYPSVRVKHPHLVVAHVSGYGQGGPKADWPGFGTLAEAMSGFAHLTGSADGPPTLPTFMLADGVASYALTAAILIALQNRTNNGGAGQLVDVSLIEPLARLLESTTLSYDQLGTSPMRSGNRWDVSAPRNAFATADGRWVAMSGATRSTAARVFRAIGRDDLAMNDEYLDLQTRPAHADEIDSITKSWIGERTLQQVMSVFEALDVAAAPVYDAEQLLADEHLAERGAFACIADPNLGSVRVQAPVARLSDTPGSIRHLGGDLGSSNHVVYSGLLGMDDADIDALHAAGVI
jgi:crotonobetainyl-CoA:carnitine CoA-transferase CaiB-like acyl-CoA transferase